jgi:CubicO group peptidase (beta-lactamase class C family)
MKWAAAVGRTGTNLDWNLSGFSAPLVFPPGEGWRYGASLDWAGQLVEKLSGLTLGAYMAEHVFAPLGIHDTGFWPEKLPQTAGRRAAFAFRSEESGLLAESPPLVPAEHEVESGGAGLYSTTADYAAFVRGLMAGKLLAAETVEVMFARQLDEVQRKMQAEVVGVLPQMYAPEYPAETPIDHGLGGFLNLEDIPGKRKAMSLMWSGYTNGHWVSDTKRKLPFPAAEPLT